MIEKSLVSGECIFENPELLDKFKAAFDLLSPDQNGNVHKDKMTDLFQLILSDIYQEDLAEALISAMGPDQDGMISLESFVQKPLSAECIALIEEFLEKNPEVKERIGCWREILGKLGLELSDVELAAVVEEAQRGAAKIFNLEIPPMPTGTEEEGGILGSGLVDAIREKMHLLHIGENLGGIVCQEEGEREGQESEPSEGTGTPLVEKEE